MKYVKIISSIVLAIIYNTKNIKAQTMNAIYDLRNVREMAAGFEFTENGHFNFYLAYGGLDRNATGTYTVENDTIKLKSDKKPAKDFEVASRKSKKDFNGFVIKVDDENKFIVSYVKAVALINGQMHTYDVSSDGAVRIDTTVCEKIFIWNQLYGDVMTEIYDAAKDKASKNFITVKMKPTLQQFSFTGIDLFLKDNKLILPANLMLNAEALEFEKR